MVLTGPIVMKFGGTSVADAEAIARVVGIVKGARESSGLPPVVIVSAMSGVTDCLLELTEGSGTPARCPRAQRCCRLVPTPLRSGRARCCRLSSRPMSLAEIGSQLDDLRALLKATGILRAASPSAHDAIAASGELMNSRHPRGGARARRGGDGLGRCAPRRRHGRRPLRRRAAGGRNARGRRRENRPARRRGPGAGASAVSSAPPFRA